MFKSFPHVRDRQVPRTGGTGKFKVRSPVRFAVECVFFSIEVVTAVSERIAVLIPAGNPLRRYGEWDMASGKRGNTQLAHSIKRQHSKFQLRLRARLAALRETISREAGKTGIRRNDYRFVVFIPFG